jgi:selenide,water dikinase
LSAEALAQVLRPIKEVFAGQDYPNLLVGMDSPDDAAVWKLDEEQAIVVTTDFFTPVVDDPYDYGAIAAANSLSDVYAMGGRPFLALNIAAFPPDLPAEITAEIVRGGAEKAREAGVVIAGGHTIQDEEPKYGLIALGFVKIKELLTMKGARPGDRLVITKPLGFGVTTTALKRGSAEAADVAEVTGWMKRLNARAAQLAREFHLNSATDITGYSLLGHGLEMANASGAALRIDFNQLPFISCARKYAKLGAFPGGAFDNLQYFGAQVAFTARLDEPNQMLLFDPQTSGGLLMAVPPERLEKLLARAAEIDQPVWVIGEVIEGRGIEVV